jgi:protease I
MLLSRDKAAMPSGKLQGVRIAILVSDGFEEFELLKPKRALDDAGAATFVIAPTKDTVAGSNQGRGEAQVPVDIHLNSAKPEDFHALLLPGGSTSAKQLAADNDVVDFVNHFLRAGKPVGIIGEGVAILTQAGALHSRAVASAGFLQAVPGELFANSTGTGVVCSGNMIVARDLDDVPALSREMIRVLAELREHSANMRKTACMKVSLESSFRLPSGACNDRALAP